MEWRVKNACRDGFHGGGVGLALENSQLYIRKHEDVQDSHHSLKELEWVQQPELGKPT
jgi:hypothetical protein